MTYKCSGRQKDFGLPVLFNKLEYLFDYTSPILDLDVSLERPNQNLKLFSESSSLEVTP